MPPPRLRDRIESLLRDELSRLGRPGLSFLLCLSDASWRAAMREVACPSYAARLASPTARRGTRGKLGMATVCHFRHAHSAVVYVKTRGRTWSEIEDTVRHEALHLARPSYSHRQVEAALGHHVPPRWPRRRRRQGRHAGVNP
ncbi:MAG TPA: hypothetical protein VNN10_14115 [Dehalococcoidia bacterium]|nr:hypothetical protein [Dehalococcoidia bacterium]